MTNELKYTVATKLTTAFKPLLGTSFDLQSPHVQFGILLNKPFTTKGTVTCLNSLYTFEDASHIANLIRSRLVEDIAPEVDL